MNQKHGHVNSKERDSFVPHTSRDRGVEGGDGGAGGHMLPQYF